MIKFVGSLKSGHYIFNDTINDTITRKNGDEQNEDIREFQRNE